MRGTAALARNRGACAVAPSNSVRPRLPPGAWEPMESAYGRFPVGAERRMESVGRFREVTLPLNLEGKVRQTLRQLEV